MNNIIQGLWIGPRLSVLEQLSVSSFLRHGHEFHLYVYDDVEGVPPGTVIRDAGEILPASKIFEYRGFKSYAGFANFFRYKLLLERGGWWVDTDVICIRPFDFGAPYVFACETSGGREFVTSGIIKAPGASEAMAYAWDVCRRKDPTRLQWGETGPRLMTELVGRFSLEQYRQPPAVFCPLGYLEWQDVLDPAKDLVFEQSTRGVHLWNEMWRREGRDKNGAYPVGCLYEKFKREYLYSQPVSGPIAQIAAK